MATFAAKVRDLADFLVQGPGLYENLRKEIVDAVRQSPTLENYTFSMETLRYHFGIEEGNDLINISPIVVGYFREDGFETAENESGIVVSW